MLDLQYGWAFSCTLHHLHKLCQHKPKGIIMITKRNLKDTYWQIHVWVHTAAVCMEIVGQFILLLLRLPLDPPPLKGNSVLAVR